MCILLLKPSFVSECTKNIKKEAELESFNTLNSININLKNEESLNVIAVSGPYMSNGTIETNHLNTLLENVLEKRPHVLILVNN